MTTVGNVLAWSPSSLDEGAAAVGRLADSMVKHVSALRDQSESLRSGWQGVAADAATAQLLRHIMTGTRIAKALDDAQAVMSRGSATLKTAREGVLQAMASAADKGFYVRPDGVVIPPPLGPAIMAVGGSDLRGERLSQQAQEFADSISQAVQRAVDADSSVAAALRGVDIPLDDARLAYAKLLLATDTGQMIETVWHDKNVPTAIDQVTGMGKFLHRLADSEEGFKVAVKGVGQPDVLEALGITKTPFWAKWAGDAADFGTDLAVERVLNTGKLSGGALKSLQGAYKVAGWAKGGACPRLPCP